MQSAIGTRFPHHPRTKPSVRLPRSLPVLLHRFREVLVIVAATLLYFLVRGLVDGREAEATRNAGRLIDLERALGLFQEPAIQGWALDVGPLGTLANWVYIWGHWPVIISTLGWLLVRHRDAFSTYRNALLLSGGLGLIVFVLFPMAPPRFMTDWGFVDTVTLHSNAYRVLQPPSLVNQYAAMPSLHVGWDLLMGIAIARHAPRRLRWLGVALPLAMYAAVVLTANHYLLDGVVGAAIVVVALAVVSAVRGMSRPRLPRRSAVRVATVR